jgi:hypothetical protein
MLYDISGSIDTPLAKFYRKFIEYKRHPSYQFLHTVDCRLYTNDEIRKEEADGNVMKKIKVLDLEKRKNQINDSIDLFHEGNPQKFAFYDTCVSYLDQFKHYMKMEQREGRQTKNFTNAWIKCWEMIHFYKLIPFNHSDDFTIFCNAEFPGAFIFAINHYIKTKTNNKNYKWFANSLWPGTTDNKDDNIFGDSFGLYKKYRDHWLMNGKDASGDVTDKKMIGIITERLSHKVDLYTSDIGIGIPYEQANRQEELEAHLNLGQVICALRTLKNGGSMICKTFMFFREMTISLFYLLTNVFDEFHVSKPMTSRPANAEIYIIGKGYRENETITKMLETLLFTWNISKINKWIVPVPRSFYLQIIYSLYVIYDRQAYFVSKNVEFTKHEYDLKKTNPSIVDIFRRDYKDKNRRELQLRQQMVTEWKKKYPIGPISQNDLL